MPSRSFDAETPPRIASATRLTSSCASMVQAGPEHQIGVCIDDEGDAPCRVRDRLGPRHRGDLRDRLRCHAHGVPCLSGGVGRETDNPQRRMHECGGRHRRAICASVLGLAAEQLRQHDAVVVVRDIGQLRPAVDIADGPHPSTLVRSRSSTAIAPRSSVSTPAASSPRPEVAGVRPIAKSTASAVTAEPVSVSSRTPSSSSLPSTTMVSCSKQYVELSASSFSYVLLVADKPRQSAEQISAHMLRAEDAGAVTAPAVAGPAPARGGAA